MPPTIQQLHKEHEGHEEGKSTNRSPKVIKKNGDLANREG